MLGCQLILSSKYFCPILYRWHLSVCYAVTVSVWYLSSILLSIFLPPLCNLPLPDLFTVTDLFWGFLWLHGRGSPLSGASGSFSPHSAVNKGMPPSFTLLPSSSRRPHASVQLRSSYVHFTCTIMNAKGALWCFSPFTRARFSFQIACHNISAVGNQKN